MVDDKVYWQSLEELRRDPELLAGRAQELPSGQTLWEAAREADAGESRRDFLKLMGFSLAAATVAACSPIPERRAVPLAQEPEELVPGVASFYATTCGGCAAGCGLLVKTRDGRPIKIEGNPRSALSAGGTCAAGQATVLSLYDDARLRGPLWGGKPATWEAVDAAVGSRLAAVAARGGGIALLTGSLLSPSLREIVGTWQRRFPGSRHAVHDAVPQTALRRAQEASFGRAVVPRYRLERARLLVALEADFLGTWLSPVELTHGYAAARRLAGATASPARHVQIESGLSLTGCNADLRIPVLPSELGMAALLLWHGVARRAGQAVDAEADLAGLPQAAALDAVADDLWRHRGESLLVAGVNDVPVQLAANRINSLLGNVGRTLDLDNPSFQAQGDEGAVAELIEAMHRGEIGALLMLGVNPAYDLPEAERFRAGLEQVALKVSFADRLDETARLADAVCPDHHFLESWNDALPVAGIYGLTQPAIAPLFATRAAGESLLRWLGESGEAADYHRYVREHWRHQVFPQQAGVRDFDEFWDRALEVGGFHGPEAPSRPYEDRADLVAARAAIVAEHQRAAETRRAGLCELRLHEKVAIRDGRQANNPWLQELPDPVSRVAWGNYVSIAPRLATELGLADGDVVVLQKDGEALHNGSVAAGSPGRKTIELPIQVQPGQPAGAVSVALGYGRTAAGKVGNGVGANAFPLLPRVDGLARGFALGYRLVKTGRREPLAAVQTHHTLDGRPIVREAALAEYRQDARAGNRAERPEDISLWTEREKEGHFWGMAIDPGACTGCGACVVACQAENNVAVVGRDEMRRGREMHWIRVDRYFSGPPEAPAVVFQPMMCQQCDHAPCETVCPVLATVHSSDGLNQQVYNRCVGTRYCANNCPYKVRRFNWFNYADNPRFDYEQRSELGRMVLNPDVVVRTRGVMEKCSMCIQRIQAGKLDAKQRGEKLADGAIQTACQQACPADAIAFGDLNDPASAVSRRQADPRFYRVLEELGTRPGVGYLTKIRTT